MSAFEDFVQTELPKRPYTDTDPSPESIMIRRGAGPRQTTGVTLTAEGQVAVYQSGTVVADTIESALVCVDAGSF